jgi:putative flavoprotein involved in K+ transport
VLPPGPVLVVGGGNSGFQIAEELTAAGRQVDLSIGTKMPVLPQRLAGRDLFWWLTRLGLLRVSVASRPGRRMSRRDFIIGGSRRRLQAAGVRFRPGVAEAQRRTFRFTDGSTLAVGTVVWATGYRSDYSWIGIPGVARDGTVIHRRGGTEVPGLYFLACRGSTPAARRCSASSATTPPISPAASPPQRRRPNPRPSRRRERLAGHCRRRARSP